MNTSAWGLIGKSICTQYYSFCRLAYVKMVLETSVTSLAYVCCLREKHVYDLLYDLDARIVQRCMVDPAITNKKLKLLTSTTALCTNYKISLH